MADQKQSETLEQTLGLIKPNSFNRSDEIIERILNDGFRIVERRQVYLTKQRAEQFYIEHKGKPFFEDLIKFMTSGPIQVQVLEGENAIFNYREVMGRTHPKEATPGTIRADFAESIDANAVHGSDSPESAKREIDYFFG